MSSNTTFGGQGNALVDLPTVLRAQADVLEAQTTVLAAQARTLRAHADALETGGHAGMACPPPPGGPLRTTQQCAADLGTSVATLNRMVRNGELPFVRVGDSRRFDLGQVRAALAARTAVPAASASGQRSVPATGVALILLTPQRAGKSPVTLAA